MGIETQEWNAFGAATVSRWSEGVSGSSSFGMSTDAFLGIQGNKKWYTPEAPGGGWIEHDKEAADQVASLLDRAEVEFDREESTRLYIEANRLMTDRQWYLTVVHDSAPVAMRQEVQGFVNAAQHSYDFKTVWLEGRVDRLNPGASPGVALSANATPGSTDRQLRRHSPQPAELVRRGPESLSPSPSLPQGRGDEPH